MVPEDQITLDLQSRHGRFALAEHVPRKKFMSSIKPAEKPSMRKGTMPASRQETTNRSASCVSASTVLHCRASSVLPKVDDLPQDEGDGCDYTPSPDCSFGLETPKFSHMSKASPDGSNRSLRAVGPADSPQSLNQTFQTFLNGESPNESRGESRSSSLRKSSNSYSPKKKVRFSTKRTIILFSTKL